ncbi:MAG: hypothetical protein M0C28_15880 [Candidatus Moduliflexus flocculans]|nr:hypothetical protein [Candidatus Moduliflexus flocculans]
MLKIRAYSKSEMPLSSKNAALKGLLSLYSQREEAAGKILHELRVGDLALTGVIPHSPYYGTVDATPLWLILYGEYYRWTKDKDFALKLLPNAEDALGGLNPTFQTTFKIFRLGSF